MTDYDEAAETERAVAESLETDGGGMTWVLDSGMSGLSHIYTFGYPMSFDRPDMAIFGTTRSVTSGSLPNILDAVNESINRGATVEDGTRWRIDDKYHCVGRFVHSSQITEDRFERCHIVARLTGWTEPMTMYQLFWPDDDGYFPWDPSVEEGVRRLQPLLYLPET